jgi:hypothetical protein
MEKKEAKNKIYDVIMSAINEELTMMLRVCANKRAEDEKLEELTRQIAMAHKVDVDKIITVHDKNPHINVYPRIYPRTHKHLYYSDYHNLHFYVLREHDEPYIFLQNDETEGFAECGCRLYLKGGNPAFSFCTMHFEADETIGVLDSIHKELNAKEWSPDTLDEIARIIRGTGREITEPSSLAS